MKANEKVADLRREMILSSGSEKDGKFELSSPFGEGKLSELANFYIEQIDGVMGRIVTAASQAVHEMGAPEKEQQNNLRIILDRLFHRDPNTSRDQSPPKR